MRLCPEEIRQYLLKMNLVNRLFERGVITNDEHDEILEELKEEIRELIDI